MIQAMHYEDEKGDLVAVDYFCSPYCLGEALKLYGIAYEGKPGQHNVGSNVVHQPYTLSWGGWPGGAETDYSVYCASCEILLWEGLEEGEAA